MEKCHFPVALKTLLTALILLCLTETMLAQEKGSGRKWLFSIHGNSSGATFSGTFPDYRKLNYSDFNLELQLGYFLNPDWALGVSYTLGREAGNVLTQQQSLRHFPGVFGRYYLSFLDEKLGKKTGRLDFQLYPFVELNTGIADFYPRSSRRDVIIQDTAIMPPHYLRTSGLSQWVIRPSLGIAAHLSPQVNLEMKVGMRLFPGQAPRQQTWLYPIFGLSYIMGDYPTKTKVPEGLPKKTEEKKPAFSQWRVSGNFTYIWDGQAPDELRGSVHYFGESTANLRLGTKLSKNLLLGIQGMLIHRRWDRERDWFVQGGIYTQYHFPKRDMDKTHGYLETGLYVGNYCTCSPAEPYKVKQHWTYPLGGGVDFNLRPKRLRMQVGFLSYTPLTLQPEAYNMTQYIIGLSWDIRE